MYNRYSPDTFGVFKSITKNLTDEEIISLRKTDKSQKVNFLDALVRFELPIIGVYFLFDGEDLIYIGQTINGLNRIQDHKKDNRKVFDSYSFVKCETQREAVELEKELIIRYKPPLNKTYAKISVDEQSEFVSKAQINLNEKQEIYNKIFE